MPLANRAACLGLGAWVRRVYAYPHCHRGGLGQGGPARRLLAGDYPDGVAQVIHDVPDLGCEAGCTDRLLCLELAHANDVGMVARG